MALVKVTWLLLYSYALVVCTRYFVIFTPQVKILFFAKSRELTGVSESVLETSPQLDGNQLLERIIEVFPR